MSGTYTVAAGQTSADLDIASYAFTSGKTVVDVYGNLMNYFDTTASATADKDGVSFGGTLAENEAIKIDTTAPDVTITGVGYAVDTGTFTISGTDFAAQINLDTGSTSVLNQLDWSKFVWDIDGDGDTTTNVTFTKDDFSAADLTAGKIVAVLKPAKKTALEATAGYAFEDAAGDAATNAADQIDIASGFIRDNALNEATASFTDQVITYNDTTPPAIVSFASSTSADSEAVYGLLDPSTGLASEITIEATLDTAVLKGSAMTVALNSGNTTDGTVVLTADATGTVMSGKYTVRAGDNTTDLTIKSDGLSLATGQNIWDIYGNKLTAPAIPTGQNLSDNEAIKIDAKAPDVTITGVGYAVDTGTFTISGTDFAAEINLDTGSTSVLNQLDWSKFVWDIDGDGDTTTNVTFTKDDFSAADLTAGKIVAVLKPAKKTALEATAGYAFEDAAGDAATNAADQIDIASGFIRDNGLNASTASFTDQVITYNDTTPPAIVSFASSTSADSEAVYGLLDPSTGLASEITIEATLDTAVLKGSAMTVALNSGNTTDGTVVLTADATGTVMSGKYTVRAGDNTTDLTIKSDGLSLATGQNIWDIYGNKLTAPAIPTGQNLSDNEAIKIDAKAPDVTITGVGYAVDTGTFTISGTDFAAEINLDTGSTSVLNQLDWSKFVWDIDGDGDTTTNVTFTKDDFSAADLTAGKIVAVLKPAKKTALEATAGYAFEDAAGDAATNAADQIDIASGFIRDNGLNASTASFTDQVITYNDTTPPAIVSFASSTSADSEAVYGLLDPSTGLASEITIEATLDTAVLKGSAMTVALNSGNTTDGTVVLTADATGTVMSGKYTVRAGDNTTDLTIKSDGLSLATGQNIWDIYGNKLTAPAIPTGQNLSDNEAIKIDAKAPDVTITGVGYAVDTGTFTISGTDFAAEINLDTGSTSVLNQLDWSKFVWDIDGDGDTTTNVTFTKDDFSAADLTAGKIVAVLKPAKKTALEATAGYAFEDAAGDAATNAADQIDIASGFIRDNGLNASTASFTDQVITYNDTTPPAIVSFASSTSADSEAVYGLLDPSTGLASEITIEATLDTAVLKGSAMTVALNSGNTTDGTVVLTADATGTVMSGKYTVRAGDNTTDLTIKSDGLSLATGQNIWDIYGNKLTAPAIPTGQNLSDNEAIKIDAAAPDVTITDVDYHVGTGTFTIAGTDFAAEINLDAGSTSVLNQLDWSKFVWDIDGDGDTTTNVTFAKTDFQSADLSGGNIVAVLTSAKEDGTGSYSWLCI